jgi:hypothetical protein
MKRVGKRREKGAGGCEQSTGSQVSKWTDDGTFVIVAARQQPVFEPPCKLLVLEWRSLWPSTTP